MIPKVFLEYRAADAAVHFPDAARDFPPPTALGFGLPRRPLSPRGRRGKGLAPMKQALGTDAQFPTHLRGRAAAGKPETDSLLLEGGIQFTTARVRGWIHRFFALSFHQLSVLPCVRQFEATSSVAAVNISWNDHSSSGAKLPTACKRKLR